MYCSQCGNVVADNSGFCNVCGCQLMNTYQNNAQQTGLPRDVFYDSNGRLNWLYRDYDREPSGNYIIRHVFDKEYIIQYYGVDLRSRPQENNKDSNALNRLAGAGMTLAIVTGDSDMHEDAAELYGRTEEASTVYQYYFYKKVKLVERDGVTGWVYFKHGFDKPFLRVYPEQSDYILNEFMKRCPKAVMGTVRKR